MAPRPQRRSDRRDQDPLRVRLWGLSPGPSDRADRLPVPGGRVASQGDRAGRAQAAAAAGPEKRLILTSHCNQVAEEERIATPTIQSRIQGSRECRSAEAAPGLRW